MAYIVGESCEHSAVDNKTAQPPQRHDREGASCPTIASRLGGQAAHAAEWEDETNAATKA